MATSAALHAPFGVALDESGNIHVDDTRNQCIRKITHETPAALPSVAQSAKPTECKTTSLPSLTPSGSSCQEIFRPFSKPSCKCEKRLTHRSSQQSAVLEVPPKRNTKLSLLHNCPDDCDVRSLRFSDMPFIMWSRDYHSKLRSSTLWSVAKNQGSRC
jgi:hypothetical protein